MRDGFYQPKIHYLNVAKKKEQSMQKKASEIIEISEDSELDDDSIDGDNELNELNASLEIIFSEVSLIELCCEIVRLTDFQ